MAIRNKSLLKNGGKLIGMGGGKLTGGDDPFKDSPATPGTFDPSNAKVIRQKTMAPPAESGSYFPYGTVPRYYAENGSVGDGTVVAPNGDTLDLHDWASDTTDYSAKMLGAQSPREFLKYAQDRAHKAAAQGLDISGSGAYRSNEDIYNEWYDKTGQAGKPGEFIRNGQVYQGYYGMDGDGHWGYYADAALTQKHPAGGWDENKASDGGQVLLEYRNGRFTPTAKRDESRAGKTVTMTSGKNAWEVRYDELGYVISIENLTQSRGIDGRSLDLPAARSSDDRGVSGREALYQQTGHTYAGPGGVSQSDIRPATREDYAAILSGRDTGVYTPTGGGTLAGGNGSRSSGGETAGGYATAAGGTGTAWNGAASAGDSLTDELRGLYNGSDSAYMQALNDLRAANDAAARRAANALEGQKESVNASYADLFRQLYIDRMRNQQNIDQRMAAGGITGGAAESTLLGLGTQYEDALRQGEQSRIGAIDALERAIVDARLSGDISTAEAAASLARENVNNYADVLRTLLAQRNADRQYNYQLARDAVSDRRYASEWAAQQQQLAAQAAYQQQMAEYEQGLKLAQLAAQYGDYSGLNGLGVDTGSYAAAMAAQAEKPLLTAAQVNAAIKAGNLTPSVLSAYEYYYGVPYGA